EAEDIIRRVLNHRLAVPTAEGFRCGTGFVCWSSVNDLGLILLSQGRYVEAELLFQQLTGVFPGDERLSSTARHHLASVYLASDRISEAETALTKVIEHLTSVNDRPVKLAYALEDLARVKIASKKYKEAEQLLRRSLEIHETTNGSSSTAAPTI